MSDLLERALNLVTPGRWGRENGYDVPSGDVDEWEIARIRLMREAGRDDLADHLIADRLPVLEALDWEKGTKRAEAFRKATA